MNEGKLPLDLLSQVHEIEITLLLNISVNDNWTPFKQLQNLIESFLLPTTQEISTVSLDSVLRKSRQYFSSLLINPVSALVKFLIQLKFQSELLA